MLQFPYVVSFDGVVLQTSHRSDDGIEKGHDSTAPDLGSKSYINRIRALRRLPLLFEELAISILLFCFLHSVTMFNAAMNNGAYPRL